MFISRYPLLSPAGGYRVGVAMPPYGEVAREWVQTAHVQAWLTRVLKDLGGEHPVPALPSCGLCDTLVLVLLESLQNLHSAVC